ncbi:hypothetical protein DDZ13_15115 [Coraliomargarita sinensis]|uniref:Uncharacterized protein n=1 Tax=Coraliomargarita sinensis TaxID=2174842 RepID=A0A317ZCG6_9BACT|nr:hypothetical protein [Coraliomargarita sinensis]PXA02825.1 hypothetical protein DDZ13_15115 [Coraliomargarita sinensis]
MKSKLIIALLAVILGLITFILMNQENETGFTEWMTGEEYQKVFDERSQRLYPVIVEAKETGNDEILFRAYYTELPTDSFWFWSNHGIPTNAFEENRNKYKREGFTLVHHHTLNTDAGQTIHQATWAKQK